MTYKLPWSRYILVPLVLLLSAAIPFAATQNEMTWLLLLLAGLGAGALLLLNPYFGLAALIISSQLVPLQISTGTQTGLNPAILLVGLFTAAWLVQLILGQGRLTPIRSSTFLPLAGFVLAAVLSFFVGQLHWFPGGGAPIRAQIGGVALFALSACTYLIAAFWIRDFAWLERLCWLFILVGAVYLLGFNYIFFIAPALGRSLAPLFRSGAAGSLFWVWLMVIPLSQVLFNRHLKPIWKLVLALFLAAVLHIRFVVGQSWTSGWLPGLVGMGVILLYFARKYLVVLIPIACVPAVLYAGNAANTLVISGNQYSITTRLAAWQILGELTKTSPILGLGPANYYWYTPFFNILGYYISFNSHNNYVDLVVQTGLVGLICFIWFFLSVFLLAWRLKDRVPDGFLRAYVVGCLGGIVATLTAGLFGDWVVPFVYNIGFNGFRASLFSWLFLGALVAIGAKYSSSPEEARNNR